MIINANQGLKDQKDERSGAILWKIGRSRP